jgi:O-Antigen ligase.
LNNNISQALVSHSVLPAAINLLLPIVLVLFILSSALTCLTGGGAVGDIVLIVGCLLALGVFLLDGDFNVFKRNSLIVLLVLYSISYSFYQFEFESFKNTVAMTCMVIVFLFCAKYGVYITSNVVLMRTLCLLSFVTGVIAANSIISKNIVGAVFFYFFILSFLCFSCSLIRYSAVKVNVLFAAIIMIFIMYSYLSGFRSMLLYALLLMVCYFLFLSNYHRRFRNAIPIFIVTFIFGLIMLYVNINDWAIGETLNYLFEERTGRQFSSGRQVLWAILVEYAAEQPLFGYGPSALMSNFTGEELSAHNYYIQLVIQLGMVGLIMLMIWLWLIWESFVYSDGPKYIVALGAACLVVFVIHNSLEVLMFQNGTIAAIPAWILIGLTYSVAATTNRLNNPTFIKKVILLKD